MTERDFCAAKPVKASSAIGSDIRGLACVQGIEIFPDNDRQANEAHHHALKFAVVVLRKKSLLERICQDAVVVGNIRQWHRIHETREKDAIETPTSPQAMTARTHARWSRGNVPIAA